MRILLLNDNPVVRKLVALSAQKTKDDLNVIWSVDEVEDDAYDLLIVDDAHYSDESMAALKEKIQYKTSLLMATRGNATPSGFDKIINKPFLPTDLVDLFAKIDQDLSSSTREVPIEQAEAIVLDESANKESDEGKAFDITNLDDDLDLEDFDIDDDDDGEMAVKTNVLDHEEVQELQDLLDDTDSLELDDTLDIDDLTDEENTDSQDEMDDDLLASLDDDILHTLEDEGETGSVESELDDVLDEFEEDEELLPEDEPVESAEEALAVEEEAAEIEEDEDLDALLLESLVGMDKEEELAALESEESALSDDEFGELEQQIQDAVEDLGIEDLEQGFDEESLDEFTGLDDLDSLSERDIKLAIGEAVEEEEEADVLEEPSQPDIDDFDEMEIDGQMTESPSLQEHHGTPAEGMDALQALLKALSNEEVSKTLKGLSINININFGNEK